MNVLAAATSLKVHYTEDALPADPQWQTGGQPLCRKVTISCYINTPERATRPVNCPKCIARHTA